MPAAERTVRTLVLWITLLAGCAPGLTPPQDISPLQTGISGQVMDHTGQPAAGAYVYAYRNLRSNLRGPADFEARVDARGHYALDLVEGTYYLVARRRSSGVDAGPPRAGDAWALPASNPVTVTPGAVTPVDFVLRGMSQPMLMGKGALTTGDTGFTGLLTDTEGNPLPGAFVIAYPDPDYHRMPEATTPAVGEDGRFHLFVERTGEWCLAARTRIRGQPTTGELYGLLGRGEAGCRKAVPGRIIDVGTIRLNPLP